jgi:exosortase A-associated hydrolase 2
MEALFLDGPAGPLFGVYHAASGHRREREGLVYLPPFAEEMNRARRMAALQARRLAAAGIDVLLLDPYGTGDSAGDFGDARWEIWREDVKAAIGWLGARCQGRVGLWGLRLGALLAAEVAADSPGGVGRLLLWQPVVSGERFLTQFLRLRVAAGMGRSGEKEAAKDLRARLKRGEALEVAGYELAPGLAEAIAGRQLAAMLERLDGARLDIMEVAAGEDPALAPATRQLLETFGSRRASCNWQAVNGEPFWSLQEVTVAPKLLQATEALFQT